MSLIGNYQSEKTACALSVVSSQLYLGDNCKVNSQTQLQNKIKEFNNFYSKIIFKSKDAKKDLHFSSLEALKIFQYSRYYSRSILDSNYSFYKKVSKVRNKDNLLVSI